MRRVVYGGLALIGLTVAAENGTQVPFPEGYHSWQHVKSVVAPEGGKIFEFYANPKAIEGYRAMKFANGSVIVRETLAAVPGENKTLVEGEHRALDVMTKDDAAYRETGGWAFETFDSKGGRLAEKDRAQCVACHAKQKDSDLVFSRLRPDADAGVPFPTGYRHWTFLHSSLVPPTANGFRKKPCEKPCSAGLFHFYANDKAMQGLRGGSYPDGAILAEEMLELLGSTTTGAKEGERRIVGVMVKDARRYSSTGGWGFGTFDEGSTVNRLDQAAQDACYQCHIPRKDHGYVFAEYQER